MCICYVTPWLPRGRTQETGAGDRAPRLLTPLIASTAAVLPLVLTDAEHVQKLPSVVTASNMDGPQIFIIWSVMLRLRYPTLSIYLHNNIVSPDWLIKRICQMLLQTWQVTQPTAISSLCNRHINCLYTSEKIKHVDYGLVSRFKSQNFWQK